MQYLAWYRFGNLWGKAFPYIGGWIRYIWSNGFLPVFQPLPWLGGARPGRLVECSRQRNAPSSERAQRIGD